jgi:tetratricopeptide (TPR) repeat protein
MAEPQTGEKHMDEHTPQDNSSNTPFLAGSETPAGDGGSGQTAESSADQVDALYQQSLLHFQNGEWRQAIAGFEEVLRLRPDHAAAKSFLEETRLKASLDKNKPKPRRLRWRGATRPLLYLLLAAGVILLLLAGGQWAYSRWVEPQRIAQQAQTRKTQLIEQAFKYLADRDYAAAEQSFRALLAEDPNSEQFQKGLEETRNRMALADSYAKAEAAIAARRWSEATQLLSTIIAQDPTYAEAQTKLAYVQAQQKLSAALDTAEQAYLAGEWLQAAAAYEALRSSDAEYQKDTVTAHLFDSYLQQCIQLVQSTQGDTDAVLQARDLYQKALTLQPRQAQVMQGVALADKYLEGQAQLANGNLQAAQEALEWVVQQQPDYAGGNAAKLLRTARGETPVAPTPTVAEPSPAAVTLTSVSPTPTPVPPTPTPIPPTSTPVPPTSTPVPPTRTPVPPTRTPVPPTRTPAPTATPASEFQRQYAIAIELGDCAFGLGEYTAAESAYLQATTLAIHLGSDAARWLFAAYVKLGTVQAKKGDNEAAVSAIKTGITIMTHSATAIPSTAYEDYVQRGDNYAQNRDYANAFAQYDKAIRVIDLKCNCGLETWSIVP